MINGSQDNFRQRTQRDRKANSRRQLIANVKPHPSVHDVGVKTQPHFGQRLRMVSNCDQNFVSDLWYT